MSTTDSFCKAFQGSYQIDLQGSIVIDTVKAIVEGSTLYSTLQVYE